jgi:uncharacterized protein (DUF1697 family)
MPALREALTGDGFEQVRTYVQSGNIVLDAAADADEVRERVAHVIEAQFGLTIAVVTRTRDDLARVIAADPLAEYATEPKRYQVSFLAAPLQPQVAERLWSLAVLPERLAVHDCELYAWHPEGIARSKLSTALAGKGLGVTATARNWTTVTALLELADA